MPKRKQDQEEKQTITDTNRSKYGFRHLVMILDNSIIADWDFSGYSCMILIGIGLVEMLFALPFMH